MALIFKNVPAYQIIFSTIDKWFEKGKENKTLHDSLNKSIITSNDQKYKQALFKQVV